MTSSPRRVLVVGGLSGIGAGIVDAFGAEECTVWSRRANGVDATDDGAVATAAAALEPAPFALLHCVGDFSEGDLLATDAATYRHLLDSNLTSAFVVARHVVPRMVAAGAGGRVVFFAAAGVGQLAVLRAPVYFAVNAALVSLARSLAAEVAPHGITVNVISPGVIRHPTSHVESQDRMESRIPMGRPGTVDDVVGAVRYLLSDAAAYVTGTELTVDGGLGFAVT